MKNMRLVKVLVVLFIAITITTSTAVEMVEGQSIVYHGNIKSKVFHKPSCRYYDCKKCTTKFNSRKEAISAGFRPCKVCGS